MKKNTLAVTSSTAIQPASVFPQAGSNLASEPVESVDKPSIASQLNSEWLIDEEAAQRLKATQVQADKVLAALEKQGAVAVRGNQLHLGGQTFVAAEGQLKNFQLLPSTQQAMAVAFSGIQSARAIYLQAAEGNGANFAVRTLLQATQTFHREFSVQPGTSVEELAGSIQPKADGDLGLVLGPLMECLRHAAQGEAVFFVRQVDRASPKVMAVLASLAAGAKVFHHPVSGEAIPVEKGFRLVMSGSLQRPVPKELSDVCSIGKLEAYPRQEHVQLLRHVEGLSDTCATLLAEFHERLKTEFVEAGKLQYGRDAELSWPMLQNVAHRLKARGDVSSQAMANACAALYASRLSKTGDADTVLRLIQKVFGVAAQPQVFQGETSPGFLQSERLMRALGELTSAWQHGETVFLRHAPQSGGTKLVYEAVETLQRPILHLTDVQDVFSLMEVPTFLPDGQVVFKEGVLAEALRTGKGVYIDHFDRLRPEVQAALLDLAKKRTYPVKQAGRVVNQAIHADTRFIFSASDVADRGKFEPSAQDLLSCTEIYLPAPPLVELEGFLKGELPTHVAASVVRLLQDAPVSKSRAQAEKWVAEKKLSASAQKQLMKLLQGLSEERPDTRSLYVQRVRDLTHAALLLSFWVPEEVALSYAARWVFSEAEDTRVFARELLPENEVSQKMREALGGVPLWQRLLRKTTQEAQAALRGTDLVITPNEDADLDACALAMVLRRPFGAVGIQSAGKSVLGMLAAKLTGRSLFPIHCSGATETSALKGGMGYTVVEGKTVLLHQPGRELQAVNSGGVLLLNEFNMLRPQTQMAIKSALGEPAFVWDPATGNRLDVGETFYMLTLNETDRKTGRGPLCAPIEDSVIWRRIKSKSTDAVAARTKARTDLPPECVDRLVRFFGDLGTLAAQHTVTSQVVPLTLLDRDLNKVLHLTQYLAKRDGIKDENEIRRLLGRETARAIRDVLADPAEHQIVFEQLLKRHFGKDVRPPARPEEVKYEKVMQNGREVTFLCLGEARLQVPDPNTLTEEQRAAIPLPPPNMKKPYGAQWDFLESLALHIEAKQPVCLEGGTGQGKSLGLRWLLSKAGWPLLAQVANEKTREEHLLVTTRIDEHENVVPHEQPLVRGARQGFGVAVEELFTIPPEHRECLNSFTEGSGIFSTLTNPPLSILPEEYHPLFFWVGTTNGRDVRKAIASGAEASRICFIHCPDLQEAADFTEMAVDLLQNRAPLTQKTLSPVKLAECFHRLLTLQQENKKKYGVRSVLSPRIFSNFLHLYESLRKTRPESEALLRAAQLVMLDKLPTPLVPEGLRIVQEYVFSQEKRDDASFNIRYDEGHVHLGYAKLKLGAHRPWAIEEPGAHLTLTDRKDLELLGDAYTSGSFVSCVDDDMGKNLQLWRLFARKTGKRVVVVNFPQNPDMEALIEKPVKAEGEDHQTGFTQEIQRVGQALQNGDLLIVRGDVPSDVLEAWNALGDSVRELELRSGKKLKMAPEARIVFMRPVGAKHDFKAPLLNRMVSVPLSASSSDETAEELRKKATDLAASLAAASRLPHTVASKLGAFHIYVNALLRQDKLSGGSSLRFYHQRDAFDVAASFAKLRPAEADVDETLAVLMMETYGARLSSPEDRNRLEKYILSAFNLSALPEANPTPIVTTPSATRSGPWTLGRKPGEALNSLDVPRLRDLLPETPTVRQVQRQMYRAFHLHRPVMGHGDPFFLTHAAKAVAHHTQAPYMELGDGVNMNEAYLFGGLVMGGEKEGLRQEEGKLREAQRQGAVVVIRHASSLSDELVAKLAELAESGTIECVVNGAVVLQPINFRLVLVNEPGEPPLPSLLGPMCAPVWAPFGDYGPEHVEWMGHLLKEVPGGQVLAAQLSKAFEAVSKKLQASDAPPEVRSRVSATAALRAAQTLAARYATSEASLNNFLAQELAPCLLWPALGTAGETVAAQRLEAMIRKLEDSGDLLPWQQGNVEALEKPEWATLRADFQPVKHAIRHTLSWVAAESLSEASPQVAAEVVKHLKDSVFFPVETVRRLEQLVLRLEKAPEEKRGEALRALKKELGGTDALDSDLKNEMLNFLRQSLLWDMDQRFAVLQKLRDTFSALGQTKNPSAKKLAEDLQHVSDRFLKSDALRRVTAARLQVAQALAHQRTAEGELDEEMTRLSAQLVEAWDAVSNSPLFVNHQQLRLEIKALNQVLWQLRDVRARRGDLTVQVDDLIETLREAGETFLAVRVAEQSIDLRREVAQSERAVESLVSDFVADLQTVKQLERSQVLVEQLNHSLHSLQDMKACDWMSLALGNETLQEPRSLSVEELQAQAEKACRADVAAERQQLMREAVRRLELENLKQAPDDLNAFFDNTPPNFTLMGLELLPPENISPRGEEAYQRLNEEVEKKVQAFRRNLVQKKTEELKAQEAERLQRAREMQIEREFTTLQLSTSRAIQEAFDHLKLTQSWLEKYSLVLPQEDAERLRHLQDTVFPKLQKEVQQYFQSQKEGLLKKVAAKLATWMGFSKDRQPPNLEPIQQAYGQHLEAVRTLLEQRHHEIEKDTRLRLPKKRDEVAERLQQLSEADVLGQASVRYAALTQALHHGMDASVRQAMDLALSQMVGKGRKADLLREAHGFISITDVVSNEVTAQAGVPVEWEPVLETLVQAAFETRQQALGESMKPLLKTLKRTLQSFDDLGSASLPPLLMAARDSLQHLLEVVKVFEGEGAGLENFNSADIHELLDGLALDMEEEASQPSGKIAEASEQAYASSLQEVAFGSAGEAERSGLRADELVVVSWSDREEVSLSATSTEEPGKKKALSGKEVGLRRDVTSAMNNLRQSLVDPVARLVSVKSQLLESLDLLEASRRQPLMHHEEQKLMEVATELRNLFEGNLNTRHQVALSKCMRLLDEVKTSLRLSSQVPVEWVANLEAVLAERARLAGLFHSQQLIQESSEWAGRAWLAVQDIRESWSELDNHSDATAAESHVQDVLERLETSLGVLGGSSVRRLAHHARQRLQRMADAALDRAHSLSPLLKTCALLEERYAECDGGLSLEREMGRLVQGVEKWGAACLTQPTLDSDQVQTFAQSVEHLLQLQALPVRMSKSGEASQGVEFEKQLDALQATVRKRVNEAQNSATQQALKDVRDALRDVKVTFLGSLVQRLETNLASEVRSYLEKQQEVVCAVEAATQKIENFDGAEGMRAFDALLVECREAMEAVKQLTGPAAWVAKSRLEHLKSALEKTAETRHPNTLSVLSFLAEAGWPFNESALSTPEVLEKFGPWVSWVQANLQRTKMPARRDIVLQLEKAVQAVQRVMHAPLGEVELHLKSAPEIDGKKKTPANVTMPPKSTPRDNIAPTPQNLQALLQSARGPLISEAGSKPYATMENSEPVEWNSELVKQLWAQKTYVETPQENPSVTPSRKRESKPGEATEAGKALRAAEIDGALIGQINKNLKLAADTLKAREVVTEAPVEQENVSPTAALAAQHPQVVEALERVYQKFDDIAFVIDQSYSAQGAVNALMTKFLALQCHAGMRSEGNLAVVGFGHPWLDGHKVKESENTAIFLHKPMEAPLSTETIDATYLLTQQTGGGTNLREGIEVAMGQLSKDRGRRRLIVVLTDAVVGKAEVLRDNIQQAIHQENINFAIYGFGEAANLERLAGEEFGRFFKNEEQLLSEGPAFLDACQVAHAKYSAASAQNRHTGVGQVTGTETLLSASAKPEGNLLWNNEATPELPGKGATLRTKGPARKLERRLTSAYMQRILRQLLEGQRAFRKTTAFREFLSRVHKIEARQRMKGIPTLLEEAISEALPKGNQDEFLRRQSEGPLFDERELVNYVIARKQNFPLRNVLKKPISSEEGPLPVMLLFDGSGSMGHEKLQASLEGGFAFGDALATKPNVELSVVEFSDGRWLHAGFDQPWGPELKAHILAQAGAKRKATDDEAVLQTAAEMFDLKKGGRGLVLLFTDGKGMPGALKAVHDLESQGYAVLILGLGGDSESVLRFNDDPLDNALWAPNLESLAKKAGPKLRTVFRRAGIG